MVEVNGLPRNVAIDKCVAKTAGVQAVNKVLKGVRCPISIEVVSRKYLNDIVEQNSCFIRRRAQLILGLKPFTSAPAKLYGSEVAQTIRKKQFELEGDGSAQFAVLAGKLCLVDTILFG